MTDYQKVAGSSLESKNSAELGLRAATNTEEKLSAKYDQAATIDTVNATKYPKTDNSVAYLAGGTISINKQDGKFVVSNDSSKQTPGILRADQAQSSFVSTAIEMKIGSETVKTLTGLIMNPSLVIRPSSNITPEKVWVKNLFPILTDSDYRCIFMYRLIQASLFGMLKILDSSRTGKKTYEEHRSYKDLGTLIIENQDFEKKILDGSIKK